ncbi:MAG: hypothetical protein P8170_00335 [Gemmatimonadota bacterium]
MGGPTLSRPLRSRGHRRGVPIHTHHGSLVADDLRGQERHVAGATPQIEDMHALSHPTSEDGSRCHIPVEQALQVQPFQFPGGASRDVARSIRLFDHLSGSPFPLRRVGARAKCKRSLPAGPNTAVRRPAWGDWSDGPGRTMFLLRRCLGPARPAPIRSR